VLVYLDSNVVIYLVEQPINLGPSASARVAQLRSSGDRLAVSDLTRLECWSRPIAQGDAVTLAQFDALFGQSDMQVVPLTSAVCDRATLIKAKYGFRTPDAVHLAASLEAGCDLFLTNDHRLSSFCDITVEVLV
jgi:predicted nucleic acid-binding protein